MQWRRRWREEESEWGWWGINNRFHKVITQKKGNEHWTCSGHKMFVEKPISHTAHNKLHMGHTIAIRRKYKRVLIYFLYIDQNIFLFPIYVFIDDYRNSIFLIYVFLFSLFVKKIGDKEMVFSIFSHEIIYKKE